MKTHGTSTTHCSLALWWNCLDFTFTNYMTPTERVLQTAPLHLKPIGPALAHGFMLAKGTRLSKCEIVISTPLWMGLP